MSITIEQSGSLNSFAYNRNEYVISSNLSTNDKFKYLTNIIYDIEVITAHIPVQFNGLIYTQVTIANIPFVLGDRVFLDGNGVCNILDISGNNIIIDTDINDVTIINNTTTLSKVISYKLDKEPTLGLGIIDYSNTLRNFCTHKLQDFNGIYWSSEVIQPYKLVFGEEYDFQYTFLDNGIATGSSGIGFVNSMLSASYTASIPFEIGDSVIIQQDLQEWSYNYSTNSGSYLAFSGSGIHNLKPTQQVFITGQTTNPQYNGYSTVISGQDTSLLVIDKPFVSAQVISGSAFGTPLPEYNVVGSVTTIYYTGSQGIVIGTDIPSSTSTQAIGGTMKFADGRVLQQYNSPTDYKLTSTGKFDKLQQFEYDAMNYHINPLISSSQYVSSIVSLNDLSTYKHRVETNTKSWMLVKPSYRSGSLFNTNVVSINYAFYDTTGSAVGTGSFYYSGSIKFTEDENNPTSPASQYGIYIPIGLNQLSSSLQFTSSVDYSNVKEYKLMVSSSIARTEPITFRLNDDCDPGYGTYHILYKDSLGSWLSYPFKYKSILSTETNTKTYYKKEGKLDGTQREYNTYDRGRTNIYKRYTDKARLTSGWVSEAENRLIKDLLSSPEVYIQDENDVIRAVQLLNTELELGKKVNNSIFNYTLEVGISIDELRF
jgi:hypothetical protein